MSGKRLSLSQRISYKLQGKERNDHGYYPEEMPEVPQEIFAMDQEKALQEATKYHYTNQQYGKPRVSRGTPRSSVVSGQSSARNSVSQSNPNSPRPSIGTPRGSVTQQTPSQSRPDSPSALHRQSLNTTAIPEGAITANSNDALALDTGGMRRPTSPVLGRFGGSASPRTKAKTRVSVIGPVGELPVQPSPLSPRPRGDAPEMGF